MPTIIEFLNARLAEREAIARAAGRRQRTHWAADDMQVRCSDDGSLIVKHSWPDEIAHIVANDPARVLADVQAKRAIVAHLAETAAQCPEDDWPANGVMEWAPMADDARYLLRLHAQPDADHPDFDPAWKL